MNVYHQDAISVRNELINYYTTTRTEMHSPKMKFIMKDISSNSLKNEIIMQLQIKVKSRSYYMQNAGHDNIKIRIININ